MHEKANASQTPASSSTPAEPTTRAPANAAPAPAPAPAKLDKTLFDLLTDVTAELIVESAKLDRLGRYLTKNQKPKTKN